MRLFVFFIFVFSLTIQVSLASTEKNCIDLLTPFNDADEYLFLKEIKGFQSTLAPEIKTLMDNEEKSSDFFNKILNLKNMHKAMEEAFEGDDEVAKITHTNHFLVVVSDLLNVLNVAHTLFVDEENGVKYIKFHKEGRNRIAMLIRRMSGEATAEVFYHPHFANSLDSIAMYSSITDSLYISTKAIIEFDFYGELETLFKPSASEFHEFLHARFETQRASGIDHALNTYLYPSQGYISTGYESFMAMEELAVYLNQANEYAAQIASFERLYNLMDWMEQRRNFSEIFANYHFEEIIRPMAINIRNYAERMKASLISDEDSIEFYRVSNRIIYIKTSLGEGTFTIISEHVIEFKFKSIYEESETFFYDRNLINTLLNDRSQQASLVLLRVLEERSELQIEYANRAIGLASKFRRHHRALDRAIVNGNAHRIRTELERLRAFLTASRNLLME